MIFYDSVLYQLEMKELKGNCVCPPLPFSTVPSPQEKTHILPGRGDEKYMDLSQKLFGDHMKLYEAENEKVSLCV